MSWGPLYIWLFFSRRGDTDGRKWRNVIQKLFELGEACKAAKLKRYKAARMQECKIVRSIGEVLAP